MDDQDATRTQHESGTLKGTTLAEPVAQPSQESPDSEFDAELDDDLADTDDDDDADGDDEEGAPGGRRRAPLSKERAAALEREGEVAADFLERLLDIADLDGDIDVDIDGDRAAVAIVDSEDGRVPRRLVGPEGKVLEALQELTRLAVQAATGDRSRLMLDVAGHRDGRRRAVLAEAREAIAKVRAEGGRQALVPMTAFERKVVHDEVLASGLVSESEGSETRRYVVVSQS